MKAISIHMTYILAPMTFSYSLNAGFCCERVQPCERSELPYPLVSSTYR